jgi:DNA replication and repair protein RecF
MLQTLEIQNIRSYQNGLFEFSEGVNIVVGPNASGKTNLLEAVHLLATGNAFKSSDEEMLRRDCDWARIDATFSIENRSVKIKAHPLKKSFMFDDIEKNRLSKNTILPIVLFEPGTMLLLSSEPERRRSYVDGVLKATQPYYSSLLQKYKRALAQRNRLLKRDEVQPSDMFVWDIQLCELAGQVVEARQAYITRINKDLTKKYRSVSGNKENFQLKYESKQDMANYAGSFAEKLKDQFDLDRIRGFTGAGPHRDDIVFLLDGKDARSSASRGETRSLILALKISELHLIEEASQKKPLLLLDDVFSELDGKRRQTLAKTLQNYQTIITTTDADVVMDHFTDCNIIPITN